MRRLLLIPLLALLAGCSANSVDIERGKYEMCNLYTDEEVASVLGSLAEKEANNENFANGGCFAQNEQFSINWGVLPFADLAPTDPDRAAQTVDHTDLTDCTVNSVPTQIDIRCDMGEGRGFVLQQRIASSSSRDITQDDWDIMVDLANKGKKRLN